jgi:hypothetical protein
MTQRVIINGYEQGFPGQDGFKHLADQEDFSRIALLAAENAGKIVGRQVIMHHVPYTGNEQNMETAFIRNPAEELPGWWGRPA